MLDQVSAIDERERLRRMFERAPGFMALLDGPDHRIVVANRAFVDLVGRGDLIDRTVSEALADLAEQGLDDMLNGVTRSGEAFVGHSLPLSVARADGTSEQILVDLVLQPLTDSDGKTSTVFIQGTNVTE